MSVTNGKDPAGETDSDFGDLLQELRILLNGVQVLVGFLIVLPFSEGFHRIEGNERWVYLGTFVCALTALIIFAAPAAQHRLMRPLPDRVRFKRFATRTVIAGLVPLSICLILSAHLVSQQVVGDQGASVVAALTTALIAGFWWIVPIAKRKKHEEEASTPPPDLKDFVAERVVEPSARSRPTADRGEARTTTDDGISTTRRLRL
ncbi:MAG: DUF6328 family protein [Fimbriimonas sp.]